MNKESKKILRRKLILLGIMLAVLFGAIAVAGIAKRGDYLAVAYAEEVNTSEWEVISKGYEVTLTDPDKNYQTCEDSYYNGLSSVFYYLSGRFILEYRHASFLTIEDDLLPNLAAGIDVHFSFSNGSEVSFCLNEISAFASVGARTNDNGEEYQYIYIFDHSFEEFIFSEETEGGNPYGCVYTSTTKWSDVDIENITSIKTDGMTIPISVKYVIVYKLPTAPEKEGYNFTGWYTDEACTNKYTGTTVTADTALYAGYEKQILTVTLDNDGATETMTVEYGNTVTLPDKTKDGYDFLGWYFSDDTKYVDQAITSNVTLTAKYRKKPVITLDNNGTTETLTVEYGNAASLPTKTKTGYNFLGWYDETGTKYDGQAVTSDLTLTAKFEVIMLKVRFFVDDAEYKSVEVPYGSKFSEAVEKASLKQTSVKSVVLLSSVAGEGEETSAEDQTIPEELTSDIKANVDVSALDAAKEQTSGWFKTTWEKIASFFVNLWEKISRFFAGAWEAVCNHFRDNWKWYAIGGGSAAGLAIVIAVICKVRR